MRNTLCSILLLLSFSLKTAVVNVDHYHTPGILDRPFAASVRVYFTDTSKWQLVAIKHSSTNNGTKHEGTLTTAGRSSGGVQLYFVDHTSVISITSSLNKKDTTFGRRNNDTVFLKFGGRRTDTFFLMKQTKDSLELMQNSTGRHISYYYLNEALYRDLVEVLEYRPSIQPGFFNKATPWLLTSNETHLVYEGGESKTVFDMLKAPNNTRKTMLYIVNDTTIMQTYSSEANSAGKRTDTIFKKMKSNKVLEIKGTGFDTFYIASLTRDSLIIQQTKRSRGQTETHIQRYVAPGRSGEMQNR